MEIANDAIKKKASYLQEVKNVTICYFKHEGFHFEGVSKIDVFFKLL